jgi:Arc/MetJ-type ribon-helix-helix transcriptional regulator
VQADGLDLSGYGPNNGGYMAAPAIKSTYTLDVATVRKLERVAARLRVSKSEVLRRAIDAIAEETPADKLAPLAAFRELQRSLQGRLSKRDFDEWEAIVRREHRGFGRKRV